MTKDRQLRHIKLADVLEKRRLGQGLNIKEFAVAAGVSYSVAREWFQIKGFPRFEGVVFWEDFAKWRNNRDTLKSIPSTYASPSQLPSSTDSSFPSRASGMPARAAKILLEATK